MEISPEKNKLDLNDLEFVLKGKRRTKPAFIGKICRFLAMSKEDRFKAGIYIGSEGREWIDHSVLVIPFLDQEITSSDQDEDSTRALI